MVIFHNLSFFFTVSFKAKTKQVRMKSFLFFCGEIAYWAISEDCFIHNLVQCLSFIYYKWFCTFLHNIQCILNIPLRVCNYQYGVLN